MMDLIPKNLLKYGTVSVLSAMSDFSVYSFLAYRLNLYYLFSNTISFIFGLFLVFYLQKNWTFQYSSNNNVKTFGRFVLIVMITYILTNLILIICIEFLGFGLLISKIMQIVLCFGWGYYATNTYVFNKNLVD